MYLNNFNSDSYVITFAFVINRSKEQKQKKQMNNITIENLPKPNEVKFEDLPKYVGIIYSKLTSIEQKLNIAETTPQKDEALYSEYIPKSEVRGKYASSSTLWHWEKKGTIKSYGIGGKRFYKRAELESLMQPINEKGGAK